jgi:dihydroneopterin aldolase/2-amino-4-hydroxy-6-hydroxymethyldihydropteridine diphosphokinase
MSVAYIGIGSNVGKRKENCYRALTLLKQKGIKITKMSSFHETEPWGYKNQPSFLNMVIEAETKLGARDLLETLQQIEKKLGREKSFKWGPRTIDLDMLLFDNMSVQENDLMIPHPLMHKREFVLKPLCEITPALRHPVLKVSVQKLLEQLHRE